MQIDYICLPRVFQDSRSQAESCAAVEGREPAITSPEAIQRQLSRAYSTLTFLGKSYNCDQGSSVQKGTLSKPSAERLDESGGGAAGVAFGRETRYKMKAQGKRSGR